MDDLLIVVFWGLIIFLGFKFFTKKQPTAGNVSNDLLNKLISILEKKGVITKAELYDAGAATQPLPAGQWAVPGSVSSTQNIPSDMSFIPENLAPSAENSEGSIARLLGKLGIVAMVIGFSFFLITMVSVMGPNGKVMTGVILGIALLALGQYFRSKYPTYSDLIFAGGIGIFYLTIYSAHSLYKLIEQPSALILMALITILAVTLSIIGGTMHLATLGVIGGFLTPFLFGMGESSMVALFSYILILDIGVLAVSVFRKWDQLNYLGFIGTIFGFVSWHSAYYTPEKFSETFFFLTCFFLVYLLSTVIHNIYNNKLSTGSDTMLVTINALAYFGLAYVLLDEKSPDILGFFALSMAIIYFFLGYVARTHNPEDKAMNIYLPGLAIVFLSIAVPLQVSGYWITLAWLIEALVLFAVALATKRKAMQMFAGAVFALGALRLFTLDMWNYGSLAEYTIIFNRHIFLLAVAVLVAYGIAYLYHRASLNNTLGKNELAIIAIFVIFANVTTLFALTTETSRYYDKERMSLQSEMYKQNQNQETYRGANDYSSQANNNLAYEEMRSLSNQKNVVISILWALYAGLLLVVGFSARVRLLRLMGLILFFVTAVKVFFTMWGLGGMYAFSSFFIFGMIALGGSFMYEKFKHRIIEVLK